MKNTKAFTLIELLVVVLIIGILAAVAVPQYQKAVNKSRAAEAWSVVKELELAREAYFLTHATQPSSLDVLDVTITNPTKYWQFYLTDNCLGFTAAGTAVTARHLTKPTELFICNGTRYCVNDGCEDFGFTKAVSCTSGGTCKTEG